MLHVLQYDIAHFQFPFSFTGTTTAETQKPIARGDIPGTTIYSGSTPPGTGNGVPIIVPGTNIVYIISLHTTLACFDYF